MRRRFLMVLLGLGVLAGFGSELGRCHAHRWEQRRQAMMDQWAHTCVDAARTHAP